MSGRRITLRYAQASDIARLTHDGVLSGAPPVNETWPQRIVKWLAEQGAGRRAIVLAEDTTGLLGIVHLIFKFPAGYEDHEVANGRDIAMMEGLRMRSDAPAEVGAELVDEIQKLAQRRNISTLTFCIPTNQPGAIRQARNWGFVEFRIMAEPTKMVAFFRKTLAPGFARV